MQLDSRATEGEWTCVFQTSQVRAILQCHQFCSWSKSSIVYQLLFDLISLYFIEMNHISKLWFDNSGMETMFLYDASWSTIREANDLLVQWWLSLVRASLFPSANVIQVCVHAISNILVMSVCNTGWNPNNVWIVVPIPRMEDLWQSRNAKRKPLSPPQDT